MKDILIATVAAALFAACLYFSYDYGFGHGVSAAAEVCGNAIIQIGVEAGASIEVIQEMVSTVCYGGQ